MVILCRGGEDDVRERIASLLLDSPGAVVIYPGLLRKEIAGSARSHSSDSQVAKRLMELVYEGLAEGRKVIIDVSDMVPDAPEIIAAYLKKSREEVYRTTHIVLLDVTVSESLVFESFCPV